VRDPRAPLAACGGLLLVSLAATQPAIVAAALAGSILLYLAAPVRHGLILRLAAISGLVLLMLNPFLALEGDRVLLAGPHFALLDLEVTTEELLWGALSGIRLATAIIATAAFLALSDPDRLQALVGRIAPRSALTVALAARLMPALRQDAHQLHEAVLLRGTPYVSGRRARARQAATLLEPLVASSLDRGVGIAEAMAARGYGGGTFTALPEPASGGGERLVIVAGVAFATLAAVLAFVLPGYVVYPQAGPIATPLALAVAVAVLLASAGAAHALRRSR
jgi:energy-coupling factor transporter transmembrane protein EcfT